MFISWIGILFLFIIFFSCFKFSFKQIYTYFIIASIIFMLFINVGTMITLPFMKISYYEFFLYCLYLMSIYTFWKYGISKKELQTLMIWLIIILINLVLLILFPSHIKTVTLPNLWYDYFNYGIQQTVIISKYTFVYSVYFFMLPIMVFAIHKLYTKKELHNLYCLLKKSTLIFVPIILAEIIIKLCFGIDSFYYIRDFLFGINSDTVSEIVRGNLISFFGLCSEPASLASSLLLTGLLHFTFKNSLKYDALLLLIIYIVGFMTGSMIFLIYAILLIVFFIYKHIIEISIVLKKIKVIYIVLFAITIFILCILNQDIIIYFINRFINVASIITGNDVSYNSESVRILSSVNMFYCFLSRPFFGVGIATAYSFSSLLSLLSNFGIVGALGIIYFIKCFCGNLSLKFIGTNIILIIISIFFLLQGSINNFVFPIFFMILFIIDNENNNQGFVVDLSETKESSLENDQQKYI